MNERAPKPAPVAHSDAMMCDWERWTVERRNVLAVYLPSGNAPDMTGTILTAKLLLATVRAIVVYVNGRPSVTYSRDGKRWMAFDASQPAAPTATLHFAHRGSDLTRCGRQADNATAYRTKATCKRCLAFLDKHDRETGS